MSVHPIEGELTRSIQRAFAAIAEMGEADLARGMILILVRKGLERDVVIYKLNLTDLEADGALLRAMMQRATHGSFDLPMAPREGS